MALKRKKTHCCLRRFGLRPAGQDLQIVIFGEIHAEVPGHNFIVAQVGVEYYAAHTVQRGGHTPGRIAQMAARLRTARAKLAHHTRQALRPVARANP